MDISKYDLYGGPNVGIYARVNDESVFLPRGFARTKTERMEEYLGVEAHYAAVANTRLVGAMMVMNNKGMILPNTCSSDEVEFFKKTSKLNVAVLATKYTALGNMVCANDKGAIVSPLIGDDDQKIICDVMGIEVIQRRIAGYHQVGAVVSATAAGAVVHPESDEDDIKACSDVFGVDAEQATINGGVPYVASGILANTKSAIVGTFTTGPEIMMLTRAFA